MLDASALLAVIHTEPGREVAYEAMAAGEASMSVVNVSEVVAKLCDDGLVEEEIREVLDPLDLELVPFDAELAHLAGMLSPQTRSLGLSFGDRACLATALMLGLPVLTTDHAWSALSIGVHVNQLR